MATEAQPLTTTTRAAPPTKSGGGLEEFGQLLRFSLTSLRDIPAALRYFSEVLRQTMLLVRGSCVFIAVMAGAIGFSATSFGYYFLKSAGAADYIGLIPGLATARFTAALLFGYAFAAKVGCGLVGEIGAMKVTEELDAYESEGVSVSRYVVATRVLASMLFTPIATAFALLGGNLGADVSAVVVVRAVSAETFWRFDWGNQSPGDQFFALVTIFVLATVITLVSCFYGVKATNGPAGVGTAVARSLLMNLVLIHVITGLMTFTVYGKNLGLPIGG